MDQDNTNTWWETTPSFTRGHRYFSFGAGSCSGITPPGTMDLKEEEEEIDPEPEPEQDETTSQNSYKVKESDPAPASIKWYSEKKAESPSHTYNRRTRQLNQLGIVLDFTLLILTASLVDRTFVPGPVNPADNNDIVAMTVVLGIIWAASIAVTYTLRMRTVHRSSLLQCTLDVFANIGCLLSLIVMIYSIASFTTADHSIFRMLPSGAMKAFPLATRLDTVMALKSIHLYVYRSFASLFCFSWLLGNLFIAIHQIQDLCSPSVLWLHAILLLLGGGASSEEVGCLITDESSVSKVSIAAFLVGSLHCLAFSTLLYQNTNTNTNTAHRRDIDAEDVLLTSAVNAAWLKRRKLVLMIYSPAAKANDDEVENDMNVLLERILMPEHKNAIGCAVSILWIGSKATAESARACLRRLIKNKSDNEWMNRVALNQSHDGSTVVGRLATPNPSDLLTAGVQMAKHILIPTWHNDDTVSLYVTVVRSLGLEDAIICCECDWPENKLVCLEAGANHVVCLKELQMEVMGRCVGAPGMADLITEICGGNNGRVVVPLQVPERYRDLPFCECSYHMFNEFGIILIGCNAFVEGTEVTLLNPSHRLIVGNAICFCLASSTELHLVHAAHTSPPIIEEEFNTSDNNQEENKNNQPGQENAKNSAKEKNNEKSKIFDKKKAPPRTRPKSKDATTLMLSKELLRPTDVSQIVRKPLRRGAPWKRPSRNLRATKRSKISGLSLLMRSDPSNAWRIGEDTFDSGRPMWSIVGKNRSGGVNSTPDGGEDEEYIWHELDDAVQSGLRNHVVVVAVDATTIQKIHHLILAIRSQERETWVPIVIVSISPPKTNVSHGNDVGCEPGPVHTLPHVYWVPGDGRSREGLLRAGITQASNIIVCPGTERGDAQRVRALAIQTRVIRLCQILAPHVILTASTPYEVVPNVSSWKCHVHPSEIIDDDRGTENDMRIASLRMLLYQFVHNPYIGAIVSSVVAGSHQEPPTIRESDLELESDEVANRSVVYGSQITRKFIHSTSILSKLRKSLQTRALIRSSFVRVRGVPKYLNGQHFIKLFEYSVYSDGGSVPICIFRKRKKTLNKTGDDSKHQRNNEKVRRYLISNMKRTDVLEDGDLYLSIIPSQYQHLLKRKHRLEKAARNKTDNHYARQLNERTATLIKEQLDVIVDIKTRMQQAYDSREAKINRDKESKAFNPFEQSDSKPKLNSNQESSRNNKTPQPSQKKIPQKTADLLKVVRENDPTASNNDDDNSLVENQDIATQVLSLLRSTTSLLSILIFRQKRCVTLRGDQSLPGATALTESQKLYQETCLTDSLIEMMTERDGRIREMRYEHNNQGSLSDILEENEQDIDTNQAR